MFQRRYARGATLAAVIAVLALLGLSSTPASAAGCDRACLSGLITQYVDALVAQDSSKLPLAKEVRFTEDAKNLSLGEGLWKEKVTKGTFRQDYLDVAKQVAAAHIQLRQGDNNVLLCLLLHVTDGKIAGVETLIERLTPESRFKPTEFVKEIRGMNDPIPAGKKQSRASLIKTALSYTEGLRIGNFTDAGTPFAPENYRVENGVITAGKDCTGAICGMYDQRIALHPGIIPSVAVVDEENGAVVLWMNFGFTNSYGPGNSLVTYEAFKIWGGQIHAIHAFFNTMPLSTPRNWPSSDPTR